VGKTYTSFLRMDGMGCIHSILPAASQTCVLPLVLPRPGCKNVIKALVVD